MKRALVMFAAAALALPFAAQAKGKPGFDGYDRNHDGAITKAEAAGHPKLLKRFSGYDRNGDGKITRAEWTASHAKAPRVAKNRSTQDQRFGALDKNKDGVLSRSEARGHLDRNAAAGR